MTFAARTVARRMAQTSIDWSSPVLKGGRADVTTAVNTFRAWAAAAEGMAEKYSAPPTPIDFNKSKGTIRDKALVENLEKFYTASTPPPETHEWSAEEQANKKAQIEEAKGRLAFTQEMIAETEYEIEFMKANMTTRETTGSDVKEAYPDIAAEVETEIENREWFKDTVH